MADGEKKEMPFITKALIVGIIAIFVIITAAGIAFFVASSVLSQIPQIDNPENNNAVTKKDENGEIKEVGTIIPFGEYTINLNEPEARYLVAEIHFELEPIKKPAKALLEAESKKVILQDKVIAILRSKSIKQLKEDKNFEILKEEIKIAVNEIMVEAQIQDVYFVKWLIQ